MPQTPLSGPPPAEVPLARSPLVRVVAQVRYPLLASIEKPEFIAGFQEAIRNDYPVLRPQESRSVVLGLEGVREDRAAVSWRFHDPISGWAVTLAPDFLALETSRYSSRDDFMARLERVLRALVTHIDPKMIDRLGVRYIDRVVGMEGEKLSELLPTLVQPEVSAILSTPLSTYTQLALAEHRFVLPDEAGLVTARWGLIPPRATVDPAVVDPIETPSWLLDLDVFKDFQDDPRALDVDATVAQARSFAERIYSIFRWAVTDEFLRRYGGHP